MKIEIDSTYDEDRIVEVILDRLGERLESRIQDKVNDLVRTRFQAIADEIAEYRIGEEVERYITEGWARVSRWGDRTGEVQTLKTMIPKMLEEQVGGDYHHRERKRRVDAIAEKILTEAFSGALKEELARAQKAFRAQVDELLKAKLTESLRKALGLGK